MEYRSRRARRRARRAGLSPRFVFGVVIVTAVQLASLAAVDRPSRGFWLPPSALSSPAAVQRAVSTAASGGFDVVVVPIATAPVEPPSFDGEAEMLRLARASGLGVHASVSVNVAATVDEWPASREHVIYQHPEWLMVPRQLASEMWTVDVRSPAYLGRLARWTRANADRVDGLYVSPLDPAAATYLTDAIVKAVQRYAVDGVHLVGMHFPGSDFDYSVQAMSLFRIRMRSTLSAFERVRLDEVEAIDPFAYAEEFPEPWRQFRETALTDLAVGLRSALTAANPSLAVTVGARADADVDLREHFQNWRSWLDRGIITRVGHRRGSTSAILFSTDGVVPPESAAGTGSAQATGIGGPR